jgi:hypothetical protein
MKDKVALQQLHGGIAIASRTRYSLFCSRSRSACLVDKNLRGS